MARTPFIGGNWKMHLTRDLAISLASGVAEGLRTRDGSASSDVAVFPAFVHLHAVAEAIDGSGALLGAQDCYHEPDGAFTGEVSLSMLRDVGVRSVLTGHSERRHVLHEPDTLVNAKTKAALADGMTCVLCVGETLAQREDGATYAINEHQLRAGLEGVAPAHAERLVIAYEPVWAIGTGKTATPDDAQRAHGHIRSVLGSLLGQSAAEHTRIIYGGSVKPANAAELFAKPDIDGFLVGGASLKAEDFLAIIRAANG
ncbi:MAG: triose-phosphate isomerase [Phycisphaerales bacterium]